MKTETRGQNNNYKVCSDCGITHTPLWRAGPDGPKTMCNACGIRWKRANQAAHKAGSHKSVAPIEPTNETKPKNELHSEDESDNMSDVVVDDSPTNAIPNESNASLNATNEGRIYDPNNSYLKEVLASMDGRKHKFRTAKKSLLHGASKKPYMKKFSSDQVVKNLDIHMNCPDCEREAENSFLMLLQAAEEYDKSCPAEVNPEKMDRLYSEVLSLRQEIEKRDAVINKIKKEDSPLNPLPSTESQHLLLPPFPNQLKGQFPVPNLNTEFIKGKGINNNSLMSLPPLTNHLPM